MKSDLTVTIPVYNGMPFIKTCIESVLAQTYQNYMILIVNDGSTDDTRLYLESINNPRVKIIHQDKIGLGATRNILLDHVHTEYFVNQDADDYSSPDRLEKQITFLKSNPEIGVCGCSIEYFHKSPELSGFSPPLPLTHKGIVKKLLNIEHAMVFPTLMFRTEVAKRAGRFRFDGIGEDWDYMLRLSKVTKLSNLKEPLYKMRLHKESTTWKKWEECRLKNEFAVFDYINEAPYSRKTFEQFIDCKFSQLFSRVFWKIFIFLDQNSLLLYRKGIIQGIKKNLFLAALFFISSIIMAPWKLIRRIKSRL
ncbi:MAG: glycosyltransferase family 2 protein [Candidatus Aminicenantes bacterium]|nr:glycosyltransferase family 2 protein [Candidatus Aminicenantes bacterium]